MLTSLSLDILRNFFSCLRLSVSIFKLIELVVLAVDSKIVDIFLSLSLKFSFYVVKWEVNDWLLKRSCT